MKSYQQLFAELKRRHVFKVSAIYGGTSFVVLQLADILLPALGLPEWTITFMVAILVLAFPVALLLAWAFEMTPEGVKRTGSATSAEIEGILSQPASQRWPAGLLALLGVVALLGSGWWIGRRTAPVAEADARGTEAANVSLAGIAPSEDDRSSIAVLPFTDMSSAGDQEYFGDGMTEEILNTLAKIRELRVAGRTSAFAYKGENEDLRKIGRELGVEYLVEGSVRKEGDELRITAQLIDAADGSHVWSESYDRRLENVFQIQEEIAESIATALRVPLGLDASELVQPTADLEAYDLYLAGRARMRERYGSLKEAIRLFEAAIARDSTWAPAWAGLAESLELIGWYPSAWDETPADPEDRNTVIRGFWRRSETAARRALELDPDNASANVALGSVLRNRRQWKGSEAAYLQALAGDPENPEAYQQYGDMLTQMGRIQEGRRAVERAVQLDRAPVRIVWHGNVLEADDRIAEARRVIEEGLAEYPDYDDLHRAYLRIITLYGEPADNGEARLAVVDSLRRVAAQIRAGRRPGSTWISVRYPLIWMAAGERDSAIARLPNVAEDAAVIVLHLLWLPIMDPLRDDPVYLATLRAMNLEGRTVDRTPR
ncbi:MAG TPA: tetratricopeptide repeat protein [Gemmatimonadota bacterium]|nr:tetratricopeptide repeat protein [Gemmatimonadota bacterium]